MQISWPYLAFPAVLVALFCLSCTCVNRRAREAGSKMPRDISCLCSKSCWWKRSQGAAHVLFAAEPQVLAINSRQPGSTRHSVRTRDLNPAFIIELDTTATVGQLFFIKKKETAQHPSRNTLSMTSLFIPSSCLPLSAFPAASETKERIWMWNGLNITVEIVGGVQIPSSICCKTWARPSRPLAVCFSSAPQQSPAETRGCMQCNSLLMTRLISAVWDLRLGRANWPSLCNFIHFQQGIFQSPSSLVGSTC